MTALLSGVGTGGSGARSVIAGFAIMGADGTAVHGERPRMQQGDRPEACA